MKKLFILALIATMVSGVATAQELSKSGKKEKKYVTAFLNDMIAGKSDELKKYIAPSYLSSNNLDIANYSINTYGPKGFKIYDYDKTTGMVDAKIWGENKSWIHALHFKVVMENGKLYLYPGEHSSSYIHPWYKVESYIKE